MPRRLLRLVTCLSLAACLTALGPVHAAALAVRLPAGPGDEAGASAKACCCCRGGECCCRDRGDTDACPHERGGASRPSCPCGPLCPAGCSFCVAKVLGCPDVPAPCLDEAPCLGDSLADTTPAPPAGLPDELFHPPRA
jgi:hypothetical protein